MTCSYSTVVANGGYTCKSETVKASPPGCVPKTTCSGVNPSAGTSALGTATVAKICRSPARRRAGCARECGRMCRLTIDDASRLSREGRYNSLQVGSAKELSDTRRHHTHKRPNAAASGRSMVQTCDASCDTFRTSLGRGGGQTELGAGRRAVRHDTTAIECSRRSRASRTLRGSFPFEALHRRQRRQRCCASLKSHLMAPMWMSAGGRVLVHQTPPLACLLTTVRL